MSAISLEKSIRECYISPMKTCTKCGEEKPLEAYARCARVRDGRKAQCRACVSAERIRQDAPRRSAAQLERDASKRALMESGVKRCNSCDETKPVDAFTPHKAFSQGRANWCKQCYNAYGAAYYRKTQPIRRAQGRAMRAVNADKYNAKGKEWRDANPDYYRRRYEDDRERFLEMGVRRYRANREEQIAKAAQWARDNPERAKVNSARRKARKRNAPGAGVTWDDWKAILDASLGLCSYCGERAKLTMDHIDPLAGGGAHDPENIAAACKTCNCSKKKTPLLVWLARQARYRALERAA